MSATVYRFQIELSDVERGVYESLDLRVARHPSESTPYLLTRVIAYALLFEEGIAFSKGGLSASEEPPLWVKDLQGNLRVWVELGTPSAERLEDRPFKLLVPVRNWPRLSVLVTASPSETRRFHGRVPAGPAADRHPLRNFAWEAREPLRVISMHRDATSNAPATSIGGAMQRVRYSSTRPR